jgi:hypothetical protein
MLSANFAQNPEFSCNLFTPCRSFIGNHQHEKRSTALLELSNIHCKHGYSETRVDVPRKHHARTRFTLVLL